MIDGETYDSDVIIYPDRVEDSWWRERGHELRPQDFDEVVDAEPEQLIVGTGAHGHMKVPNETVEFLANHDISTVVKKIREAWRYYNEHAEEDTIAAFHLTC